MPKGSTSRLNYEQVLRPLIGEPGSQKPFVMGLGGVLQNPAYVGRTLDEATADLHDELGRPAQTHDHAMIQHALSAFAGHTGYAIGSALAHNGKFIGAAWNQRLIPKPGQDSAYSEVRLLEQTYHERQGIDPRELAIYQTAGTGVMGTMCLVNSHVRQIVLGVPDLGGGFLAGCPDALPRDYADIWRKHEMAVQLADIPPSTRHLCHDLLNASKRELFHRFPLQGSPQLITGFRDTTPFAKHMPGIEPMIGPNKPFLRDATFGIIENPDYPVPTKEDVAREIEALPKYGPHDGDAYLLGEALKVGLNALMVDGAYGVGAVVSVETGTGANKKSQVVSYGANRRTKYAKVHDSKYEWNHAEVIGIDESWSARNAGIPGMGICDPRAMTLTATLEPCPMCAAHAMAAGIRRQKMGTPDTGGTFALQMPENLPPDLHAIWHQQSHEAGMADVPDSMKLASWRLFLASRHARHVELHGTN